MKVETLVVGCPFCIRTRVDVVDMASVGRKVLDETAPALRRLWGIFRLCVLKGESAIGMIGVRNGGD